MKQEAQIVRADTAGAAFATDPELRLPEYPCFIPELLAIPQGADAVLIAGCGAPDLLSGRDARHMLRRIVPLLDGRTRLRALPAALPDLPADAVLNCVALLWSRGFLEDGDIRADAPDGADPGLLSFLGRFNDASRCNRNRSEAWRRLARARIAVEGPVRAVGTLAATLAASGAGIVPAAEARGDPEALLLRITTGAEPDIPECHDTPRRFVPIRLGAAGASIGPLIGPGTICPQCLARLEPHPKGTPDPLLIELALGLAAQLILATVCLTFPANLHRGMFRCRAAAETGLSGELAVLPRSPGCPACGLRGHPFAPGNPSFLAWLFHTRTALPPRAVISRRDHQNHYRPSNVALTQSRSGVAVRGARVALPAKAAAEPDEGFGAGELATILRLSAGERTGPGGTPRRIAPTGGNLGSPRVWVLARHVAGLGRGLYLYDPAEHALQRFGGFADGALSAGLRAGGTLPAAVLVVAGDLARCRRKYGDFGFRVVHFDAGVALAYLSAVCRVLDVACTEYPCTDPALLEAFGIPLLPEHPLPISAVGLGPLDPGPAHSGLGGSGLTDNAMQVSPDPPEADGWDPGGDMCDVLVEALRYARAPIAPESEPGPDAAPLPAAASFRAFSRTAMQRRSVRRFANRPPPAAALRQVVAAAHAALALRKRNGAGVAPIRLVLALSTGPRGHPAGLWRTEPSGAWTRFADFGPGAAGECFLQESLAVAPACLVAVTDLDAAPGHEGLSDYRRTLAFAGTALGAAWLEATRRGVDGCISAGVLPAGFEAVAGFDTYTACPLLALHLGHEASAPSLAP